MAVSFKYIQRGRKLVRTENGYTKVELIKILGLPITGDIEYEAIKALAARNPPVTYLCPHHTIPDLYLTGLETLPVTNSKTQIVVMLSYSDLRRVTVTVDGTVVQEMTTFEADGTPHTVLYLPPDPANNKQRWPPGFYPQESQQFCEKSGLIPREVLRPGMMMEFERWRISTSGTVPETYRFLQGATNASKWQNCDSETWLCTGVSPRGTVHVNEAGQLQAFTPTLYRERLTFQYRGFEKSLGGLNNSWRGIIYYTDSRTGESPSDIDPKADKYPQNKRGNGWREVVDYPFANFDFFKLPTIFAAQI